MEEIQFLTPEEIETLQVDAALRLLGKNVKILVELNKEIGLALIEKGQAEVKLQQLKQTKNTLIEMNRCLKTIAQGSSL